nr:TonB-dependent receptor [Paracidobacterium acidisoli]
MVFSVPAILKAQAVASITGVVTDQTGAVIPGVHVTLSNPQTGVSYTAVSNGVGSYSLHEVQPGPGYRIEFTHDGFTAAVISGLYLNVDATRTQNAQMNPGTAQQTVEVSASNQDVTLDTTDATVGNNFQVQFLNDLPVQDRSNPSSLFTQQPGTTLGGAVTGAREDQDNVTLDGLDVNDNTTGQFGTIVANAPVDSVQEFRGVTGGQLSSAGEGGGAQYELVTRSGTNHFHGSLVEYHRDTDLEANDWFNNNAGVPRPPLIRNQFGGNIGGPFLKNRLFFFFDYNGRRDTLTNLTERVVPLDSFRAGQIAYVNNSSDTNPGFSSWSPQQVTQNDPQGIGFNPALNALWSSRYPHANDFSGACDTVNQLSAVICPDEINTAGFRFNAPFPLKENDYVSRLDYNLNSTMKIFARATFTRQTATQTPVQFPGDPQTYPFFDKSYSWVVGHNWSIGSNKVNQFYYGETFENYSFPVSYSPTGSTNYTFGSTAAGGTILDPAYGTSSNGQYRTFPVPVIRDDFNWEKGRHSIVIGGTFKYLNPDSTAVQDYNNPNIGVGGHIPSLDSSLRPADIDTGPNYGGLAASLFDEAYTLMLGHYSSVGSTFNYDANGNVLPQGTGSHTDYRYYETEIYVGDTWKVTPSLTLSYGLRWQNYTVPYEKHGLESVISQDFASYFAARIAQSAAGQTGPTAVPILSYSLAGKANHAPGYFDPVNKNFAPRFAFAYSPSFDRKSVFSGGGGIIYDHTVVNSVLYQEEQNSYLFQASNNNPFGIVGNARQSLLDDPRFGGFSAAPPPPPSAPVITKPFAPFIDGTIANPTPYGLANGQAFSSTVDKHLKTPYSIMYNFGWQHEFPEGFIAKVTYVGRLGRRLLAQVDAEQLIDFPDHTSGQMMSNAFANLTRQVRSGAVITPQPWFENVLTAGVGQSLGYSNNTEFVADAVEPYVQRGDFADTMEILAGAGVLPDNAGMASQFSENTYYTNQGFSSYNGLLTTLHKNAGHGLQFDLNYTWSHSIDNTSLIANSPASGFTGGPGFICDELRPRECRANSNFDETQILSGNFIYDLPVGRGRTFAATAPFWLNEFIGGWELSGLPSYHSGVAYSAVANAFVAGYSNNAPPILIGPIADMKIHTNGGHGAPLNAFANVSKSLSDYTGPIGFQIGSRNNLRGPQYFNMDMGLGKTFPLYSDKVNLKFRADAFNVLNHPNFDNPTTDITSPSFGIISSTVTEPFSFNTTARVLQVSGRLEF